MTYIRDLRKLTDAQLGDLFNDKKQDMHQMRLNKATGELKDTAAVRRARREVARILTVLRERQLATAATMQEN